jgi:hypothetical protein
MFWRYPFKVSTESFKTIKKTSTHFGGNENQTLIVLGYEVWYANVPGFVPHNYIAGQALGFAGGSVGSGFSVLDMQVLVAYVVGVA